MFDILSSSRYDNVKYILHYQEVFYGFFWISWLFIAIYVVLLSLIAFMLFSLSKRGDERSRFIKTKAMSTTFIWTVVILVIETVRVMPNHHSGTNPLLLLVLVSFIFLVSLIVYKRKYGDLG